MKIREQLLEAKNKAIDILIIQTVLAVEEKYKELQVDSVEHPDYLYNQAIKAVIDSKQLVCQVLDPSFKTYTDSFRQISFLETFYRSEELSSQELDQYCIEVFEKTHSYEEFSRACNRFVWRGKVSTKRFSEWYSLAKGILNE